MIPDGNELEFFLLGSRSGSDPTIKVQCVKKCEPNIMNANFFKNKGGPGPG